MSAITLETFAMTVECPVCAACELAGDDVEPCWDDAGDESVPTHDERLDAARELLARAQDALERVERA
jgi:hypothetical protein